MPQARTLLGFGNLHSRERPFDELEVFLSMLASIEEGDGTLLDNSAILCTSDCSWGAYHLVDEYPVIVAGRAGGRLATGQHIAGTGDPVTRIGLTMQQLMGLPVERWGLGSMETNKSVGELFA